eukprot:1157752-Pelagomonas_calceolata.AAC.3
MQGQQRPWPYGRHTCKVGPKEKCKHQRWPFLVDRRSGHRQVSAGLEMGTRAVLSSQNKSQ